VLDLFFDRSRKAYRETIILPHDVLRVSIEAGTTFGWERDHRRRSPACASASTRLRRVRAYEALYDHFGLTAEAIVETANRARLGTTENEQKRS
jgi:transketolase